MPKVNGERAQQRNANRTTSEKTGNIGESSRELRDTVNTMEMIAQRHLNHTKRSSLKKRIMQGTSFEKQLLEDR